MCQMFSVFDARSVTFAASHGTCIAHCRCVVDGTFHVHSNVSVVVDERDSRLVILCDMTMSLAPDPEQKKFTTSAAIVIKKTLGVDEEKMLEEQAILDRSALGQRLMELEMLPGPAAE